MKQQILSWGGGGGGWLGSSGVQPKKKKICFVLQSTSAYLWMDIGYAIQFKRQYGH